MGAQHSAFAGYSDLARHEVETPVTFHCFMKLPMEIRFMIYDLVPGPRVVEVAGNSQSHYDSPKIRNEPPVTLAICRESRREALRRYHHLQFQPWGPQLDGIPLLLDFWLDPTRDTLYFGYNTSFNFWPIILKSPFLQQHLQYLAWTCSNWPRDHPTDIALRRLEALKEMIYVCDWGQPHERDSGDIKLGRPYRKKNVPGSVHLYRENQLLGEFRAAKDAHPEWAIPEVKAAVLLRGGEPPEECDQWWCFCHGEKLSISAT